MQLQELFERISRLPVVDGHEPLACVARYTLEHFFGEKELNETNLWPVKEQLRADFTPGLYDRVLRQHCGITNVLNQDTRQNDGRDLDVYDGQTLPYFCKEALSAVVSLVDTEVPENIHVNRLGTEHAEGGLESYLAWAAERLRYLAARGAVGFKTCAMPFRPAEWSEALQEFNELKNKRCKLLVRDEPGPLFCYIHEELLKVAAELRITVAVHTGFWGDFRQLNPTHMIPVIQQHPEIHFDLFHAGIPYVREMGVIAVNFPNTSVNLCWAHSISPSMTARALDEYIDLLGSDRIIAFGGDVAWLVHKVYGHLEWARRNVAAVLARRVQSGLMDSEQALRLACEWFEENPRRIYRLTAEQQG